MSSNRVTLKEVARDTGVSIITVSRVLNETSGKYPISAKTRGRVLASTKRLGYRPNVIARALRSKSTGIIALLYQRQQPSHFGNDDFYLGVQGGIEEVLGEHDKNLLICSVVQGDLESGLLPDVIEQGLVDACLLFDISHPLFLGALTKRKIPVVAINTTRAGKAIDCVLQNNPAAIELILDRLVSWGHRRLALVTARAPADAIVVREEAFLKGTADRGLTDPLIVRSDPWSNEAGNLVVKLRKAHPELTAIVGTSDGLCVAVLGGLTEAGHRVPDDISVVSCGGHHHWLLKDLALMTVRFDQEEMGQRAAAMVLRRLGGVAGPPCHEVLAGQLIEGTTAGPRLASESKN